MSYFFTADEHLGHKNIIDYCDRPFATVEEMDDEIIRRHNEVVKEGDTVYHLGDFTMKKGAEAQHYIGRLNGNHIFIKGSHDYWMEENAPTMIEKMIGYNYFVMCHYPMKSWPRSFHGSLQLFGHCHGRMTEDKNQMDVGVDTNNFYPYSFKDIINKLKK